jgi:hypothetical protein
MKQKIFGISRLAIILCLACAACLSSCEQIGIDETYSFTSFTVKVVYSDTTYLFTCNGDTIPFYGYYYPPVSIGRKDLSSSMLRAYRGDVLELDSLVHLSPLETLTFIQLPGEKIKLYDANAGGDEPDPTDATCVKVRFTPAKNIDADSLRFIWMSSSKANLSLPGSKFDIIDTTVVYKAGLSKYVELDTDRYAEAGSSTYFHYTRQTWDGSAWTGSSKTAVPNNFKTLAGYKFATFEISAIWQFTLLFGEKW